MDVEVEAEVHVEVEADDATYRFASTRPIGRSVLCFFPNRFGTSFLS